MHPGGPKGPAHARRQTTCVVCGQDNPRGLQIQYGREKDGAMVAEWNPSAVWEGFDGIIHGGIVSTVLDEAMSKAVAASGAEALTAELRVRFRQPVNTGRLYRLRGWVVDRTKRRIRTEAALVSASGEEHAHAWAVFLTVRP